MIEQRSIEAPLPWNPSSIPARLFSRKTESRTTKSLPVPPNVLIASPTAFRSATTCSITESAPPPRAIPLPQWRTVRFRTVTFARIPDDQRLRVPEARTPVVFGPVPSMLWPMPSKTTSELLITTPIQSVVMSRSRVWRPGVSTRRSGAGVGAGPGGGVSRLMLSRLIRETPSNESRTTVSPAGNVKGVVKWPSYRSKPPVGCTSIVPATVPFRA